jgi:hypothetical protein
MASHREVVMLQGKLRGMGREASCILSAIKISSPLTGHPNFTKCDIHQAPDDLPDGRYEVTFGGQTAKVKNGNGFWLAG